MLTRAGKVVTRWAGVVVAALTLAGCATAGSPPPIPTARDGITPAASIEVHGRSVPYSGTERWSSASVPSRSSARLTVFATGSPDSGGGPCGPPAIRILTLETPTTVRVLVADYEDVAQPGTACAAVGYSQSPHTVRLRSPIGSRTFVDAVDRRTVAVLDSSTLPDLQPPAPFTLVTLQHPQGRPALVVRTWSAGRGNDVRWMTLSVGSPATLTGDQSPYGKQVGAFAVKGVPATLYDPGDADQGYEVQWTPNPHQTLRLTLSGTPQQRWTAAQAVALARAVTGYRTTGTDRLPAPRTPGTAAVEYSSADGPVHGAPNLLKSSGVYVGVSCLGSGTATVALRGATFRSPCTDRLATHVHKSVGSPTETFRVTITATAGARWTVVLARASLDGS